MKNQIFGILFYLLYLLAMVRPIIPIIEYHANYDYIASALCENRDKPFLQCNGKCYLQKQLEKNNFQKSHDHKPTIPSICLDDYPISPISTLSYKLNSLIEIAVSNYNHRYYHSQNVYTSILKPPQILS